MKIGNRKYKGRKIIIPILGKVTFDKNGCIDCPDSDGKKILSLVKDLFKDGLPPSVPDANAPVAPSSPDGAVPPPETDRWYPFPKDIEKDTLSLMTKMKRMRLPELKTLMLDFNKEATKEWWDCLTRDQLAQVIILEVTKAYFKPSKGGKDVGKDVGTSVTNP